MNRTVLPDTTSRSESPSSLLSARLISRMKSVRLVRMYGTLPSILIAVAVALFYSASIFSFFELTFVGGNAEDAWSTFMTLSILMLLGIVFLIAAKSARVIATVLFYNFLMLTLLGYALGNHSIAKLLMTVVLLIELGFALSSPLNWISSLVASAILCVIQLSPGMLGENTVLTHIVANNEDFDFLFLIVISMSSVGTFTLAQILTSRRELSAKIEAQERSIQQLELFNIRLQSYADNIDKESAQRERLLITREIHDVSGYVFTNLIAMMDAAISTGLEDPIGVEQRLIVARKQAQEGLSETRSVLRRLRGTGDPPTAIDGKREILKMVQLFQRITGVRVSLSFGNFTTALSSDREEVLRRIVQESLTNAIRHGKAKMISIHFWLRDGKLYVDIMDDGIGAHEIRPGLGLSGMRERLQLLDGNVSTESIPGSGFHLKVALSIT